MWRQRSVEMEHKGKSDSNSHRSRNNRSEEHSPDRDHQSERGSRGKEASYSDASDWDDDGLKDEDIEKWLHSRYCTLHLLPSFLYFPLYMCPYLSAICRDYLLWLSWLFNFERMACNLASMSWYEVRAFEGWFKPKGLTHNPCELGGCPWGSVGSLLRPFKVFTFERRQKSLRSL
jgi:hypothetical protein